VAKWTWPLDRRLVDGPAHAVVGFGPAFDDNVGWQILYNAAQRDPSHLDWLLGLGRIAHRQGNSSLAFAYFAKACALAPRLAPCLAVSGPVPLSEPTLSAGLGASR